MGNYRAGVYSHFHAFGIFARTVAGGVSRGRQHHQYRYALAALLRADYYLLPKVRQKSRYRNYRGKHDALYHRPVFLLDGVAYSLDIAWITVRPRRVDVLLRCEKIEHKRILLSLQEILEHGRKI